ncbi:MAG: hypothetical protein M1819_002483 [Sarea resinae]|nr:MAG: hypothetical protein M1819_002483 [Sarea resinae]
MTSLALRPDIATENYGHQATGGTGGAGGDDSDDQARGVGRAHYDEDIDEDDEMNDDEYASAQEGQPATGNTAGQSSRLPHDEYEAQKGARRAEQRQRRNKVRYEKKKEKVQENFKRIQQGIPKPAGPKTQERMAFEEARKARRKEKKPALKKNRLARKKETRKQKREEEKKKDGEKK